MAKILKPLEDSYSADEIAQRRDDAIRRALATPPSPLKGIIGKSERAKAIKKRREEKKDNPVP